MTDFSNFQLRKKWSLKKNQIWLRLKQYKLHLSNECSENSPMDRDKRWEKKKVKKKEAVRKRLKNREKNGKKQIRTQTQRQGHGHSETALRQQKFWKKG